MKKILNVLKENKDLIKNQEDNLEFEIYCADDGYSLLVTTVNYDVKSNKVVINVIGGKNDKRMTDIKRKGKPPIFLELFKWMEGEYAAVDLVELTGYSKSFISKICKEYDVPFTLTIRGSHMVKMFDISAWNRGETQKGKQI